MNAKSCSPVSNEFLDAASVVPGLAACGSRDAAAAGTGRRNRWLHGAALALAVLLAFGGGCAWAQEDQDPNPHTPGEIPNPGTYTGSMELQRQDQPLPNIQSYPQQSYPQQSYPQPRYNPQPTRQGSGAAPAARQGPPPMNAQPFGKWTAADHAAEAAMVGGGYARALRLWSPLAERGDVNAQYALGLMYDNGMGVAVNKAEAARWYRMAADRGYGSAMLNLGRVIVQISRGRTGLVPAYKWFLIAETYSKDPTVRANAVHNKGLLMRAMSYREITQAENQARGWVAH